MYPVEALDRLSLNVELSDLSYYLPIGYWHRNHRYEYYQCQTFNGFTEAFLTELEDRYSNIENNLNLIYGLFLERFISHLDNISLDSFDISPSKVLQDFYFADIVSMILNIRLEHQGWEIALNSTCPCSKQYKIRAKDAGYHDLSTVEIKIWQGDDPPIFNLLTGGKNVTIKPPLFKDIPRFYTEFRHLESPTQIALICSDLSEEEFYNLPSCDRALLVHWANRIAKFSADPGIEMSCPQCGYEWTAPLVLGENYEHFYLKLLSAPRFKNSTFEEYIDNVASILVIGENAPLKSIQEVYALTPKSRDNWAKKMQEFYENQKRELDKAKK